MGEGFSTGTSVLNDRVNLTALLREQLSLLEEFIRDNRTQVINHALPELWLQTDGELLSIALEDLLYQLVLLGSEGGEVQLEIYQTSEIQAVRLLFHVANPASRYDLNGIENDLQRPQAMLKLLCGTLKIHQDAVCKLRLELQLPQAPNC